MASNKGLHSSSGGSHSHSHRGRPYALILLITFGVALLGVMVLHRLRERGIYTLLVKEKNNQILALQLLLQKERDRSKKLRGNNEEMKGKIYTLRSQKMELARTVDEMQSTLDSLKDEHKLVESAFEEQQKELRLMQEKGSNVRQGGSPIVALSANLKHKEAEIEDLKRRFEAQVKDHPIIFPETVTANGTMTAQDKTEIDGNSGYSAKYEGDDSEDARKSKLTKFTNREVESDIKDEIQSEGGLGKANVNHGGGTAKDIEDSEVVDGRGKKAIREEHAGQVETKNNADGGAQVKQLAGMKRKHGHIKRKKGKRWGTIFKSSSIENNGVSDNHMGNRKVYRDELKGRLGKISDERYFSREDEGRVNNSPRKDKSQAKLLKPENHDSKEETNGMEVNNTNHQLQYSGTNIERQRFDEMRQSEEHDQTLHQQNWSKRHINTADKNAAQTKSKVLLQGPEELKEVLGVQNQEKSAIGNGHEENDEDFLKETQSDFEEKDEYNNE